MKKSGLAAPQPKGDQPHALAPHRHSKDGSEWQRGQGRVPGPCPPWSLSVLSCSQSPPEGMVITLSLGADSGGEGGIGVMRIEEFISELNSLNCVAEKRIENQFSLVTMVRELTSKMEISKSARST